MRREMPFGAFVLFLDFGAMDFDDAARSTEWLKSHANVFVATIESPRRPLMARTNSRR